MTSANGLPSITTFTGKTLDFENPDPDSICIEDIAHALSMVCRFSGQCRDFYSVAQHSVLVSLGLQLVVPPEEQKTWWLWQKHERQLRKIALLHDAAEAYMGDLNRPLKRIMPQYSRIEDKVFRAISMKFKLMWQGIPDVVKAMDKLIFANEWASFMPPGPNDAGREPEASIGTITAMSQKEAETAFLGVYHKYFLQESP